MSQDFQSKNEASLAAELFNPRKLSVDAFKDILTRLNKREGRAPSGEYWSDVVEDYVERAKSDVWDIFFDFGPPGEIFYGYFQAFNVDHGRLGNIPVVQIPPNLWQIKGQYTDNEIAQMLIDIVEISRLNSMDENRISKLSDIGKINYVLPVPGKTHSVRRIKVIES